MLTLSRKQQTGIGLLELMIGILVGTVLLSGVISLYVRTSKGNIDNLRLARLNQEVRAITGIMTREIRRAGYWGVAPGTIGTVGNPAWITALYSDDTVDLASNPFWDNTSNHDVIIDRYQGGAGTATANSCITFTYDLDEDRIVGDGTGITHMEQFGFRLRQTVDVDGDGHQDSVLEMRLSGTPFNCTAGTWEPLNDPKFSTVTNFSLTLTTTLLNLSNPGVTCAPGHACQSIRHVTITLSMHAKEDATLQQTVSESIHVRNDRYAIL